MSKAGDISTDGGIGSDSTGMAIITAIEDIERNVEVTVAILTDGGILSQLLAQVRYSAEQSRMVTPRPAA